MPRVAELADERRTTRLRRSRRRTRQTPASRTRATDQDDMPLPTEPRTIFLGGLFLLALLAALYVASPIVLPVVLAIVLKLLLQPLVRLTDRAGLPRALGALLAILLLVVALAALISGVAGPAASWAGKLPEAIPQIQQQLAIPRPPDQHVPMDDGAVAERRRWRARRAAGAGRRTRSTSWARCSAAPLRLRPGCSPRWSCCSTCWCRARRSCVASSRSCRASPRSVRPWRSRWISSATSPPI